LPEKGDKIDVVDIKGIKNDVVGNIVFQFRKIAALLFQEVDQKTGIAGAPPIGPVFLIF